MWHALRAELVYFRTPLLVAWSIALGVALLVNGLTYFSEPDEHPGTVLTVGLPGFFFVTAGMVVAFIAQGPRGEGRRSRLLLGGTLRPLALGIILVLLPAVLIAMGVALGGAVLGVATLMAGALDAKPIVMISAVASQMVAVVQMGPLAQESTVARRQGRTAASTVGWILFVAAIGVMALAQTNEGTAPAFFGNLALSVVLMIVSARLYGGRTDFTQ